MMQFSIRSGIPFISVSVIYQEKAIRVDSVLVDTGSATTIFSADLLAAHGVVPDHHDEVHRMVGIGGTMYEYERVYYG